MTRSTDPAFEIKGALDREVERRFDGRAVVAAIEGRDRAPGGRRAEGPLARVPAPVQWIGILAAVIAAATGIRSVYLDLAAPRVAPSAEVRERAAAIPEPSSEELVVPEETEPHAAPPATTPAPARRPPRRTPTISRSIAEAPLVAESAPSEEPARVGAVPPPAPPALRTGGETVVGPSAGPGEPNEKRAPVGATYPGVVAAHPGIAAVGAPPRAVGGVTLLSLRGADRDLPTDLVDLPRMGATLVLIGGEPARRERDSDQGPPERREPAAPSEFVPPPPLGGFVVRLLEGGGGVLAGAVGTWSGGIALGGPNGATPWDDEPARSYLARIFALDAVVGPRAVLLPSASDGTTMAEPRVQLGSSTYRLVVIGARGEGRTHRLDVHLSRGPWDRSQRRGESTIAASLRIEDGRVAILAIPRSLFAGRRAASEPTAVEFVFLLLSPRLDRGERRAVETAILDEDTEFPPIRIEGIDPDYPDEARALGVGGRIVLRAVVREDGTVEDVELLEAPGHPGARYLYEAAAAAVRQWVYLPARRSGEPAAAYVRVTFDF